MSSRNSRFTTSVSVIVAIAVVVGGVVVVAVSNVFKFW